MTGRLPRARFGLPDGDLVAVPINRDGPAVRPDRDFTVERPGFTFTVAPAACLVVRIGPVGDLA